MANKSPAAWGSGILGVLLIGWLVRTMFVTANLAQEQDRREHELMDRARNEFKGMQAELNLLSHRSGTTTQSVDDTQPATQP